MNDTLYNMQEILDENNRRNARLQGTPYYPLVGTGCWGDRVEVDGCRVPRAVLAKCPDYKSLAASEQQRQRIQEDFEYWCARCVTIKDKMNSCNVPFVLNRPQRRLLAVMESQRVAGRPVRVVLLKARQWGGSTLIQIYMAWMQLVRHKGWNSLICGHLHVTSKNIKRMYNLLLRHYPREFLDDDDDALRFTKLEGQPNVQQLEARDCLVLTGSSRSEDAVRGYDITMAHLSEVAFWQESAMHSPDDVVRSVCGSIALKPETVIVLESTANGVGDYFHDEWLRAMQGRSDKEPVFVPWHEIGIYTMKVDDYAALWHEMDEYERGLWDDGCTLEQINWYHHKRREYRTHELMMAEYPSNASEAFTTSGNCPFVQEHLDKLEQDCCLAPVLVGDIYADGQVRMMVENEAGETVGIVDLVNFDPSNCRAEVGLIILDAFRRRGLGSSTLNKIADYALKVLHLHQLFAFVDCKNEASVNLFLHSGYNESARIKDWLYDGREYRDAVMMQLVF